MLKKFLIFASLALSLTLSPLSMPASFADDEVPADGGAAEEAAPVEATPDEDAPIIPEGIRIPPPKYLPGPGIDQPGQSVRNRIFNETVPTAINIAITVMALFAFTGIIIAAFTMFTAFGNEDKYNTAKNNLRYALIGLLLVIFSYAIVSIVSSLALPTGETSLFSIPTAEALNTEQKADSLLPNAGDILNPGEGELLEPQLPDGDLTTELIPAAISIVFFSFGFLIFVALSIAGLLLVFGRGNEDSIKKAKDIITYCAFGLALAVGAYTLIFGILNLNFQNDPSTDADDIFIETQLR